MKILLFILTFVAAIAQNKGFAQNKPFQGALYYHFSVDGKADNWGKLYSFKLFFSSGKVLYDSIKLKDEYYKVILDPSTSSLYILNYKENGKNGYKIRLKEFFQKFDTINRKEAIRHLQMTGGFFNKPDSFMKLVSIHDGKQIAGISTKETILKFSIPHDKDTLNYQILKIYVNNSLGIKLSDYDFLLQGLKKITVLYNQIFSEYYSFVKDGLPVAFNLKSPVDDGHMRLELVKVEHTSKYEPMFDISHCVFEDKTDIADQFKNRMYER